MCGVDHIKDLNYLVVTGKNQLEKEIHDIQTSKLNLICDPKAIHINENKEAEGFEGICLKSTTSHGGSPRLNNYLNV